MSTENFGNFKGLKRATLNYFGHVQNCLKIEGKTENNSLLILKTRKRQGNKDGSG